MTFSTVPQLRPQISCATYTSLDEIEMAADSGALLDWNEVIADDPAASVFQGPAFALAWYRMYRDEYTPFVVAVFNGDDTVGIVPLATRDGRLVFAGGSTADYRDVAAKPGYREATVRAMVEAYRGGGFGGPLPIGWIDESISETPVLLARICSELGLPFTRKTELCWRWSPQPEENLSKKFARVRTHLNYFRKLGGTLAVESWAHIRDEFIAQHNERQTLAARPLAFADRRRRGFYDQLAPDLHVTALRVDGRLVAGHVGLVQRDVLMFGATSFTAEHEQRSPSLVLLSWIVQSAAELGLSGLDLTIGDSEFKRRIGNYSVTLSTMNVYARRREYWRERCKRLCVDGVKRAAQRVGGPALWTRIKAIAKRDW